MLSGQVQSAREGKFLKNMCILGHPTSPPKLVAHAQMHYKWKLVTALTQTKWSSNCSNKICVHRCACLIAWALLTEFPLR